MKQPSRYSSTGEHGRGTRDSRASSPFNGPEVQLLASARSSQSRKPRRRSTACRQVLTLACMALTLAVQGAVTGVQSATGEQLRRVAASGAGSPAVHVGTSSGAAGQGLQVPVVAGVSIQAGESPVSSRPDAKGGGVSQSTAPARTMSVISGVRTSPAFFNPSIGQRAEISCTLARAGEIAVEILDRDRFVVRKLARQASRPGTILVVWDGRDDAGLTVPDEAYTSRISFSGDGATESFDPTEHYQAVPQDLTSCTYSRTEGILSYTLEWPARVLILAGQATQDPTTHVSSGPILKTIVDRQPRAAGAVVESWNGMDASGRTYVPDLAHFVVAFTVAKLPEGAVIAVGNRATSFFDYSLSHRPKNALAPRQRGQGPNPHYVGLGGLEDANPNLELEVRAPVDPATGAFSEDGASLDVALAIEPRRARYFLGRSAKLNVFVDEKLVLTQDAQRSPAKVTVPVSSLLPGPHRVVVNWASGFGPVAVNSIVINRAHTSTAAGSEKH